MRYYAKAILLCLFVIAVSASVTEKILKIPLFEVGEIWINSLYKLHENVFGFITSLVDVYSFKFYIFLIASSVSGYYIYKLLFTPLDRIRILGDIGYISEGKFTLKEISNSVKRRRMVGEIPPVYPNGWFGLIEGFKLKRGEAKSISALGKFLHSLRQVVSNQCLPYSFIIHKTLRLVIQ